jgi:hypothetical protein
MDKYTVTGISRIVNDQQDELFNSYIEDKPTNWSCCSRTKQQICIGEWLHRELIVLELDDIARFQQEGIFHREGRSRVDLYSLVAEIMNDTIEGKIDRNRKPMRRWG